MAGISGAAAQLYVTAQAQYMQSLADLKPAALETAKPMPRQTILEFFGARNTKMALPSAREALADEFAKTKQVSLFTEHVSNV